MVRGRSLVAKPGLWTGDTYVTSTAVIAVIGGVGEIDLASSIALRLLLLLLLMGPLLLLLLHWILSRGRSTPHGHAEFVHVTAVIAAVITARSIGADPVPGIGRAGFVERIREHTVKIFRVSDGIGIHAERSPLHIKKGERGKTNYYVFIRALFFSQSFFG